MSIEKKINIQTISEVSAPRPERKGAGEGLCVLSDIKKELRANMNGVASAHQRQSEDYRINWGIELPRIMDIAKEFEPSRELAQTLWNEHVRECKILACLLMPTDDFIEEICDIWAESIRTEEIAMMFCLHLVKRLPYAGVKAFEWMASESRMLQNCGFLTMCHLLRQYEMNESSQEEFLDQASAALDNKYAIKALQIYASLSEDNTEKVKKIADYL